jgi:hypothetical protein
MKHPAQDANDHDARCVMILTCSAYDDVNTLTLRLKSLLNDKSISKVTRLRPYHGAINKSHVTSNKEQANNRATGKKNPMTKGGSRPAQPSLLEHAR